MRDGAASGRDRRPVVASGLLAAVAACALAGCSGSNAPRGGASTSVARAVTCPGGVVNSGTPDSADGTQGITDIADHARTWARESGFADRFPAAKVSVQEGEERAFARFDEEDDRRAELAYRKVKGGWAIDSMTYC